MNVLDLELVLIFAIMNKYYDDGDAVVSSSSITHTNTYWSSNDGGDGDGWMVICFLFFSYCEANVSLIQLFAIL